MRIIANYHKGEPLRFLSHLDIQRLLQRALRRAEVPVAYSQGFNPHPLLSFASALAVGYTSEAEWADIRLAGEMAPEEIMRRMNHALPPGFAIGAVKVAPEALPTLTALTHSALYRVALALDTPVSPAAMQAGADALLSGPVIVNKRTKAGMRDVDIRPQALAVTARNAREERPQAGHTLDILGVLNVEGSLNVELLMQALLQSMKLTGTWRVHRSGLYFEHTELLPHYPGRSVEE